MIPFDWFSRTGPAALDGYVHPDFLGVATALQRQLQSHPGGAATCTWSRPA